MTQTEALSVVDTLKLALEALEDIRDDCSGCEFEWNNDYPLQAKAHAAIKEALRSSPNGEAQPAVALGQESMFTYEQVKAHIQAAMMSTTPPQRKPLTDAQREEIAKGWRGRNWTVGSIIDAIEAVHGIKGDA